MDNALLKKYSETGPIWTACLCVEEIEDSLNQIQLTNQKAYTYLLRLHIPIPPQSVVLFRDAFVRILEGISQSVHVESLELVKEMATQIPWDRMFEKDPKLSQKCKKNACSLLFKMKNTQFNYSISQLEVILALWMTLSSKYAVPRSSH